MLQDSHNVYHASEYDSMQSARSAGKKLTLLFRLSRSLNVIESDADRLRTYDFLLVIYSSLTIIGLSCIVFKTVGGICRKITVY